LGSQNYGFEVAGIGYHGIQKVRYYTATNIGNGIRIEYPIVYVSGANFSGTYVNNAWYALHAGCGNNNGIASCAGVCTTLGKTYLSITGTCGSGYAGAVTNFVNPDRCIYTSTDSNSGPWNDYSGGSSCHNPMFYCDCTW
jgi:hypothetical protein